MDLIKIREIFKSKYSTAIVTGGAGFIGSHIIEELLGMGIKVTSIDDYSSGKSENLESFRSNANFCEVNCDISDIDKLKPHFQNIDIVFHNAASKKNICLTDPRRDLDVNGKGAFNIFELARDCGVKKVVHASTGSVYGEAKYFPQDEKHPLNPSSYYGVSKLAGERYGITFEKLYDLDVSVLRYFHVYGPRQEFHPKFGGVVSIFIKNILDGINPTIYGDGSQQRSFTSVKDVVKANLVVAISKESKGNVYNCASGINVTISELCDYLLEKLDITKTLEIEYTDWMVGDIKVFEVDNSKISNIGMEFEKDFFSEVGQTIEWLTNKLKN